MFEPCPIIEMKVCDFAHWRDGECFCGQGRGDSRVKKVKSCNGKHPQYDEKELQGNGQNKRNKRRSGSRSNTKSLF